MLNKDEATGQAPVAVAHGWLPVDGAELYHEGRGEGPLLVIVPGGPQDAGVFSELAALLADRHRVVTYDPRGNSRTRLAGPPEDLDVDQQADDLAALIAHFGGTADVFGTSGGAQIALSLAARHPGWVRMVVAHEPPAAMLLPDPETVLAADRALIETFKRDGVEAAMGQFFAENGLEGDEEPPVFEMPPEAAETFARVSGNFRYWLEHGLWPLTVYQPDIAALRERSIVVALGEGSAGQPIAAMSEALATALGGTPTLFPGDHVSGFDADAAAFAERLHDVLTKR